MNRPTFAAAMVAASVLVGCSTLPRTDPAVESARATVAAVESDPAIAQYAPLELARTRDAWQLAENAWRHGDARDRVHHLAYLADRQATLARETARLHAAQAAIGQADTERARIRLEARTREAERARAQAAQAQATAAQQARAAAAARTTALLQEQQTEQARAIALAAAERARAEQERATAAQQQAGAANAALADLRERTDRLAAEVDGLKASTTDRGTVVTLGDVLFDVDRATLNPGGERAVRELASALEDGTGSSITVAGFTDASGASTYNQSLSERRAQAVRDVLVDAGVPAERVATRGYGESYPVATNATTAGRQLNRRVEVFVDERKAGTQEAAASR